MKRILPIVLTLCVIVSALAFTTFGAEDSSSGGYSGKILHWQNYVVKYTTVEDSSGYRTYIDLPRAWHVEQHAAGVHSDDFVYFEGDQYYFTGDIERNHFTITSAFYLSLEDLQVNMDPVNTFDIYVNEVALACDAQINSFAFGVIFYDAFNNELGRDIMTDIELNDYWYDVPALPLLWASFDDNFNVVDRPAGAAYIKFLFEFELDLRRYDNQRLSLAFMFENLEYITPVVYSPGNFPIDGLDAWLNGYYGNYPSQVPGEEDIWEHFRHNQVLFKDFITSVRDTFSHYSQGFRLWSYAFSQFYTIKWVGQLVNASIAIGAIAFFFGIAVESVGRIGSRTRQKVNDVKRQKQRKSSSRNNSYKKGVRKPK